MIRLRPHERQAAVEALATRVPVDLLWLFRHAWQSTRGPFAASARGALTRTEQRAAPGCAELVAALLDRGLDDVVGGTRIDTVLDLRGTVDLDHYRITSLRP